MNYLKTAFNILPVTNTTKDLHLFIEVGWEGISFVYYSKSPFKLEGLLVYQFDKNSHPDEIAENLKLIFQDGNLADFTSCRLCYNFKESSLIPKEFYHEDNKAAVLDCLFGKNFETYCYSDTVATQEMINVYRVDKRIEKVLNQRFPNAVYHHSNSIQLTALDSSKDALYCNIYQNTIKVILVSENRLQLLQFFEYTTPSDVAYHLLNCCAQHNVNPEEIQLVLSGFIETDSNLYNELYRFFLNIQISSIAENGTLAQIFNEVPVHFFSQLIQLSACES